MGTLEGRVALITGGSRGLGFATAMRLAQAGASVAIVARNLDGLQQAEAAIQETVPDASILCIQKDVSKHADTELIAYLTRHYFGRIDVLICCAGIFLPRQPFADEQWPTWADMIKINMIGTLGCCHAVLPVMLGQQHGRIVTIAGGGVGGIPTANMAVYTATKAAVVQFTESLGRELDGTGVTVNAVAPGPISEPLSLARATAMIKLLSEPSSIITGRFFSAFWDEPTAPCLPGEDNAYRLRRTVR